MSANVSDAVEYDDEEMFETQALGTRELICASSQHLEPGVLGLGAVLRSFT